MKLFKKYSIVLLLFLLMLLICALIECFSFTTVTQSEIDKRYYNDSRIFNNYADAANCETNINEIYGEKLAEINIDNVSYYLNDKLTDGWKVTYKIDLWFDNPPVLTDLLSRTTHIPLVIGTIIFLSIIIIISINKDYRPINSVITILRLPRPRSRYVLSKLVIPVIIIMFFWLTQFVVVKIQEGYYLSCVPAMLRPSNSSPWAYDYYHMLYPVFEPIWFLATICVLCMIPLIIVTAVLISKGRLKNWVYWIFPLIGIVAIVIFINHVWNMWWVLPVLLIAIYVNCRVFINKGQIVR